jgi:hypothetical protein
MRDPVDLISRSGDLKQTLLLALKYANSAVLDGTHDQADLDALQRAIEQARTAREQLETLHKRLAFHVELGRVSQGAVSDESSRGLISLVRLGVDGGYDVTEVRRMIDQALGRA